MSAEPHSHPDVRDTIDIQYEMGGSTTTKQKDAAEDDALHNLGYASSYRRALKTLGTVCIVISLTSPLSAIYISAFYQIENGGYWGLTWGWLIPSIIFFPQALATALFVSSMPVNGAYYWWTAALAPRWCSRFISYVAGWCALLTLATSTASFSYAVASSVVIGITYVAPSWTPDNAQLMGITFAIVICWAALSALKLENISWVYVISSAIIALHLIVFLIAFPTSHAVQGRPFAPASEVLGSYTNYSEWTPAVAVPFTWFTASWVNSAWSAPAYVAEATKDARRSAPRAIVTAYATTAVFGLLICLVVAFCITDMDSAVNDPTGFPILTLILDHWGPSATAAFVLVVMIPTLVGGSAVLLAYSFQIAAFARDGGVPFYKTFAKVNERVNMPVYAILAECVGTLLLLLFTLSSVARTIIYSLAVMAYLLTYALPNFMVLFAGNRWVPGPFSFGRFDKPIFAWACLTQVYLVIMEAFPSAPTWDALTFNYNWVVTLGVLLFAAVSYPILGKNFKGIDIEAMRELQQTHGDFDGVPVSPTASRNGAAGLPLGTPGYHPSKSSTEDNVEVTKLHARAKI